MCFPHSRQVLSRFTLLPRSEQRNRHHHAFQNSVQNAKKNLHLYFLLSVFIRIVCVIITTGHCYIRQTQQNQHDAHTKDRPSHRHTSSPQ